MAKAEVLANLRHDRVSYKLGDTIEADDATIARLEEIGVVKVVAEAEEAAKAEESNKKTKTTSKSK